MRLNYKAAKEIYTALSSLDGIAKSVEGGAIIIEPFILDGATRSRIARNKNKLRQFLEPFEEALRGAEIEYRHQRDKMVRPADPTHENMKVFSAGLVTAEEKLKKDREKIMSEEGEVDLRSLDFKSLQMDKNIGIMATTLDGLSPIIEEMPE